MGAPTINTVPTPTPPVATPTPPPVAPPVGAVNTVTPPSTPTAAPASQPTGTTTNTPALTMPPTGSVVDLLNSAGEDSSLAARSQLAQQFGIAGYTGSATQNQDLSKKYLDFYNSKKGTEAPATNPRQDIQDATQQPQVQNPEQSFIDNYFSLNPVAKQLYDYTQQVLSPQSTQQTFMQQYQDLTAQAGIPALQTQLMNVQNVMDGTEDDIRTEITKAGGFATESQIQALTGARNKTLLHQANLLSNQLQAQQEYVNNVMQFSEADRAEVEKQIEQKTNLLSNLSNMEDKINSAAKDNFNQIIQTQGYGGLYGALQGDPQLMSQAEKILGLGEGGLAKAAAYIKPLTAEEKLQNENLTLQNQKLKQDLQPKPAAVPNKQFISGTANQPAGVFNPQTGEFTPTSGGTANNELQLSTVEDNIGNINSLLSSPALSNVVGPNMFAKALFGGPTQLTGENQNFLAGLGQLTNQLTLKNLQDAKANGATFGALSEGELSLVSSSASKLNGFLSKDKDGNVTGVNASESSFKTELDKINNYAKLDYILKGGSPSEVGVTETSDGKLWTKNSDGSITEIR